MNSSITVALIAASSALLGSIIGGLFAMWAATRAHKRQLELQQLQLKGQMELKARELMFGVYQRKLDEDIKSVKELGAVVGKLGLVINLPDIDENDKINVMMEFIGTVKPLAEPILETIDEIESELNKSGLWEKWEQRFLFAKQNLVPDLTRITPQQIEGIYENLTKALAYIAAIQNALVEKKREELFSEYLPSTLIQEQK